VTRRTRQPVPESLMSSIDAALTRVTTQGVTHAANATPVATRQLRDVLHALVGLRLSLFPATITTSAPPAPPKEEPAA
jgi:hypothetical protein